MLEIDIADGHGSTRVASLDEEFAMIIERLDAEAAQVVTEAAFSRMRATDRELGLAVPAAQGRHHPGPRRLRALSRS